MWGINYFTRLYLTCETPTCCLEQTLKLNFQFSFVKVILSLQFPSTFSELCKLHYASQGTGNRDFPTLTENANYKCPLPEKIKINEKIPTVFP